MAWCCPIREKLLYRIIDNGEVIGDCSWAKIFLQLFSCLLQDKQYTLVFFLVVLGFRWMSSISLKHRNIRTASTCCMQHGQGWEFSPFVYTYVWFSINFLLRKSAAIFGFLICSKFHLFLVYLTIRIWIGNLQRFINTLLGKLQNLGYDVFKLT